MQSFKELIKNKKKFFYIFLEFIYFYEWGTDITFGICDVFYN